MQAVWGIGRTSLLNRLHAFRQSCSAAALLACAALTTAGGAIAHPHSFLDVRLGIVMSDAEVSSFEITWLFDDVDTEIAVDNNDRDGDGKLDEQELRALADRMARTTGQFGFHLHIDIDGKRVKSAKVSDFRLSMKGDRLQAGFRASLPGKVDPRAHRLIIGLYDDSYWIQFSLDPARDISVSGSLPAGCGLETFKDRRTVIYELVGQKVHPTVTEIVCGN